MNEMKFYWSIDKNELDAVRDRLNQAARDDDPNDEANKDKLLIDASFGIDEMYLDKDSNSIYLNCPTTQIFGRDFGFMCVEIPLSQEMAISIVDRYMKQLGKLKTILEATK